MRAAAAAAVDARCASRTRARTAVSFRASSSASRATSTAADCRTAGRALQLLGLAVAPLTLLLGLSAALRLPRANPLLPTLRLAVRHESQIAARGAGEDLEARRGQFLGQSSLAELLRAVAIDGGAEERVGDPTKVAGVARWPWLSEQIASPGDKGVQLGALALQGFTGCPRIAELRPAHALHAVYEPREPLGVLVRKLIRGPKGALGRRSWRPRGPAPARQPS